MSQVTKLTSSEEFVITGGRFTLEPLKKTEALICSDASSSVAGLHAWETFFSARALSQFGTDIISAPFPCGTMSFCLQNTPYVLGEGNIEIISSPATTDFTKVFGDPFEMVQRRYSSAKARAISNGLTAGEADKITNGKISRFVSNLPATIFGSSGVPYPAISVSDNIKMVNFLKTALYPDASGNFRVENPMCKVDSISLGELAEEFISSVGSGLAVMMKCVCPECSYSGTIVEHVIGSNGKISNNYSSHISGHDAKPKCKYMRPILDPSISVFEYSVSDLINAGFMPQGICLYLLEIMNHANDDRLGLGIRDYSNPRGIVRIASKRWSNRVVLTPRGYIRYGDRDASAYELMAFANENGFDLLLEFSKRLPTFGDNHAYILDLQSRSITIK